MSVGRAIAILAIVSVLWLATSMTAYPAFGRPAAQTTAQFKCPGVQGGLCTWSGGIRLEGKSLTSLQAPAPNIPGRPGFPASPLPLTNSLIVEKGSAIVESGRIGIGSSDPQALLHILGIGGSTDMFHIGHGSSTDVRVSANGFVGIGGAPTHRLRVHGDENDGNVATFRVSTGNDTMLFDGNEVDSLSSGGLFLNHNSKRNVVLVDLGGRVGVGLSNPAHRLHIQGADNDGKTAAVGVTSGSQELLIDGNELDTSSTDGLFINHNSQRNVLLVDSGGRVGIGTANPSHTLRVNGSLRAIDGIVFPDGIVRTKAERIGPPGLAGRDGVDGGKGGIGPVGPLTRSYAMCATGNALEQAPPCPCAALASFLSPCSVTSDTGECSAISLPGAGSAVGRGRCCVCQPQL